MLLKIITAIMITLSASCNDCNYLQWLMVCDFLITPQQDTSINWALWPASLDSLPTNSSLFRRWWTKLYRYVTEILAISHCLAVANNRKQTICSHRSGFCRHKSIVSAANEDGFIQSNRGQHFSTLSEQTTYAAFQFYHIYLKCQN